MNTSETINELAGALAKAQGAIEGARKDAFNPHFKAKYADLASVWDACRAPLSSNGLAIVQVTGRSDKDEVVVTTRLLHTSGQWIEGTLALPVSKADAQGFGSALTYARRYGLAAIVGVAPDDDDGELATIARPEIKRASVPETAIADLLSGMDEAVSAEDLEQRLKTSFEIAKNAGDLAAHRRFKEHAIKLAKLHGWERKTA